MSVEWATAGDVHIAASTPAELAEEEFSDDYGSTVDAGNAALILHSGAGGAFVVEGDPEELEAFAKRLLAVTQDMEGRSRGLLS